MPTSTISLEVDSDTARAFSEASAQEQQKIQLQLALRLRQLLNRPVRPLKDVMNEISREAQERGLTPEILESILNEP